MLRPGHGRWPDVDPLARHAVDFEDLLQVIEGHLGRLGLGSTQYSVGQLKLFGLKNSGKVKFSRPFMYLKKFKATICTRYFEFAVLLVFTILIHVSFFNRNSGYLEYQISDLFIGWVILCRTWRSRKPEFIQKMRPYFSIYLRRGRDSHYHDSH